MLTQQSQRDGLIEAQTMIRMQNNLLYSCADCIWLFSGTKAVLKMTNRSGCIQRCILPFPLHVRTCITSRHELEVLCCTLNTRCKLLQISSH